MANIIEQVNVNGTVFTIASSAYAVCSTAASEAAKTINITGFSLITGVTIHVKFANANSAATPTLTIAGGDNAANNPIPIIGTAVWDAGAIFALTYDGTNWVQDYDKVTENAITGTGTTGALAKFSGTNTLTSGPLLSSAIASQDTTTKFLREDGTWAAPSYISNTHYQATLIAGNAATDTSEETVSASATGIFLNLVENSTVRSSHQLAGAGGITIGVDANGKITFTGKSGTVTSITPGNGLINGTSGSSQTAITTSGTISIKEGGVTNAMLVNDSIELAGQTISLGDTVSKATLLSLLGIGDAVHYIGESSTTISDGGTETPTITGLSNYTASAGDIVVYDDKEFIWTAAGAWELFGDEGSYALKSNTVTNVAWDGTNNKLTKTINGSTSDVVTISTIKTALNLVKGDVGLDNVTNHAQVTSLQWDTTNKKITYKVSEGSATNLLQFAAGSSGRVTLTAAANKLTIEASDTRVSQKVLASNGTNADREYAILFKNTGNAYTDETAGVKFTSSITINPSTGTLTATKFSGDGTGLSLSATAINTALSADSTSTDMIFWHKSGSWKKIKVDASDTATANVSDSIAEVDTTTATLKIHSNVKAIYSDP